jgi:drug/metabolite transporter (DMT)-like permease
VNLRSLFYFAAISIFWGGSFLGIHYVVLGLPPTFGAFLRALVGLVATCLLIFFGRRKDSQGPFRGVPKNIRRQAFFAGVFNIGIPWIMLFYAEKIVSPALSSIYNSTSTIFVALLAPVMLASTNLTRRNVLGVVIGFIGILFIFGPSVTRDDVGRIYAQLALVGMAICYAVGNLWIKRLGKGVNITTILFYQCLSGAVVLGSYSLIFEAPWRIAFLSVPMSAYISVLYLGLCSTFLAWLMYIRLIHDWGAVQAIAVTYVLPLVSIALDIAVLHKVVRPIDAIGALIILAGVWLVQKRAARI